MLSVMGIKHNNISFGRAVRPNEEAELTDTSAEVKKYLGIKKLALGIHRSSYPVAQGDLFIGSNMNEEALKLNKFAKMFGFDSFQDGPPGLPSVEDPSPYKTTVFSKSYLNTDMKKLATPQYGEILDMSEILSKGSREYEANSDMTDFKQAFKVYDELFEQAYDKMATKTDSLSQNLKSEFEAFKNNSGKWLQNDAEYEALKKKIGNEDFENWSDSKIDNPKELELYKFKQFILSKQEKAFILEHPEKLDVISDGIIGFSPRDVRNNQNVFLKDFRIGCPGGGAGVEGQVRNQAWGLHVVNPKTIFNEDGSLGAGGKLIEQKISSLLESAQNIRIDHVLGLIDPWIYDKNKLEVVKDASGKIVSTNAHGAFLSEMNWDNSIDPKHNYTKILEEIIEPTLKKKGVNIEDVVFETLGDQTKTFREVYFDKLHLPEMKDLRWERGENIPKQGWISITNHDEEPFSKVVQRQLDFKKDYILNDHNWATEPNYLIGFLHPEKTNEQRAKLINDLTWDARLRNNTKYEELFRCGEKIEVFFTDLFGLGKTYNHAGMAHPDNWKLRLPHNYQENFYKNLENKEWKNIALNMPELFKRAVISKIYTAPMSRVEQDTEFNRMKPLIDKLDKFEKILYEPEHATRSVRKIAIDKLKEIGLARLVRKVVA